MSQSPSTPKTESNGVPRREGCLAAAFLVALLSAVHYDVLLQGRSLVLTNLFNPLDPRPIPQNYGNDMVAAAEWTNRNLYPYANIRDPGATWWQWEPSHEFFMRGLKLGEWPFWDPYVAGGTPAMTNLIPAFFFPPHLALTLLGGSMSLKNAYFLFLLWGAAFTSFLFLRRHRLSFLASLTGAAVVLMGGSLNQNLGSFMGQTAACLPPVLYVTRLFLDRPNDRRRTIALTLTYSGASLASFPPLIVAVFGTTALYALISIALKETSVKKARSLFLWTRAALTSMGLVAFYYLPALALREAVPHVSELYHDAALGSMGLLNALQLLSPTLMGGIQVYVTMPFAVPGTPHIPYVGVAAVVAALLARPTPGRRGLILFVASAVAAIAVLLKLFGIPPVQWIAYLPFFKEIHLADYFGVPLGFLVAFLAALGVDSMVRSAVTVPRAIVVAAAAVAAITCLSWIGWTAGAFQSPAAATWIRDWKVLVVIMLVSIGAILHTSVARRTWVPATMATVLLGAVCVEGVFNNTYPNPKTWDIFEHPVPYMEVLRAEADKGRVLAFGAPTENLNEAFEVSAFGSIMPFNPPRVYNLYKRYTDADPPRRVEIFMREPARIPPEPVLDRANIAFLGVRRDFADVVSAAEARGYQVRFDDGFVVLFERQTLPRFFFSSQYRVMPASKALDAVAGSPSHEIVLEERPPFLSSPSTQADTIVRVEVLHRNTITLRVDAPRTGFLYASDSYFDGWTARVNGRPARIHPANFAFRAVAIPPGSSRVEFFYQPPGLTAGLTLSGISLLVLVWFMSSRPGAATHSVIRMNVD